MRLAVLSDIHGNFEAFKEVLADIQKARVDRIVCLGDNVGYGPEPEAVVNRMGELDWPCVKGNHELALEDDAVLSWFNFLAQESLVKTKKMLSAESLNYCRSMPTNLVVEDCLGVHGCPPNSMLTYIIELGQEELVRVFQDMEQEICFVGHTHMLGLIRFDGRRVFSVPLSGETMELDRDSRYIVNVGAVGQPRDGLNNQAKYVIYDTATGRLEVRFVPYDIAATANKIIQLGLPEFHARRLW